MNFDKHSNFNPKANFSEVKFGENMPVLEVELNELQQIQNEARADIIRDSIPSGFVTLGEIDYEYCKSNNNQIKLKTESIAYVNGYRITIPKDTIIEIGESDKVREDLVFLEVWKEVVTDESDLKEYGGEQNADIENPIKDERYPIATSQRVALKYRIRHVADLNFSKTWEHGMSPVHPYIGWDNSTSFSPIYAIGGDEAITKPDSIGAYKLFRCATFNDSSYPKYSNDIGLWVAGRNDESSFEYFKNASIDGYVYAIPMFRLLRKPNVGLASPFEYKKIHNQLDPKKFAHLVGQENVEKVHSVNVKGKTFKNLLTHAKTHGNSALNINISPDIVTFDTGTSWGKIGFLVKGEPNTKYIFHCSDFYRGEKSIEFYVRFSDSIHATTHTLDKIDSNTYTFTTDSSGVFMFTFEVSSGVSGAYVKYPILMKYSEWEEQLRGKKIVGVQSLGEESNNSITIENNLVEEGTYVPELQNHILPTHPEVTHVSWGENVVIPPEVEIELKRGEELLQTITQLPVKLETTGEEKLHVKGMKGRTLVNVNSCYTDNDFIAFNNATIDSDGWITITANGNYLNVFPRMNNLIKPNTKYLAIIEVKENTLDGKFRPFTNWGEDTCFTTNFQDMSNGNSWVINENAKGVFKSFLTTKDDIANAIVLERSYVDVACTTGSITYRTMLIEYQQGMENWDILFFRGMQSVEEPKINVVGQNLYTHQKAYIRGINNQDVVVNVPVSPNTTYTFDASSKSWATVTLYNTSESESRVLGGTKDSKIVTFTTDSSEVSAQLVFYHGDNTDIRDVDFEKLQIQFIEGSDIPPYELGKLNELRTPKGTVLRSLNSSFFDSIDFDSGFIKQNIDELMMNGSIEQGYWILNQQIASGYQYTWRADTIDLSSKTALVLCDSLVSSGNNESITNCIWAYLGTHIVVHSPINNLDTFKDNLKNKPLTVLYLKSSPITKKIGLSEDDYLGKSKVTYQLAEPLHKVGTYSDFIKGDTLFSNIGVEVLNGSEEWVRQNGTDYGFYLNHPNSMPNTPLISPQLPTLNDWEGYARKGIFRGSGAIGLVVSADDLSENTLQGFKNWLQDNPVTIYYVKANPVEIPLKEVSPLECDFSLNRQFKRGYENCLKELPNGVKDVVENGKVKRRTQRVTLTGNEKHEDWSVHTYVGNITNTMAFRCSLNFTCDDRNKLNIVCDKFKAVPVIYFDHNDTPCIASGQQTVYSVLLRVPRSSLSSEDVAGLRLYLKNNPINLICELETSVTEELTEENCRYVPYMPLNSYVGSLYVANGNNQTKFLTAFSPSEYEVQTYHRYFSNEFNVFEDIKRKKSPYGHKTYLEEVEGKYVEKFTAGLEKHEIEDLRHKVSLTGFDYNHLLQDSFLKLIKGELS